MSTTATSPQKDSEQPTKLSSSTSAAAGVKLPLETSLQSKTTIQPVALAAIGRRKSIAALLSSSGNLAPPESNRYLSETKNEEEPANEERKEKLWELMSSYLSVGSYLEPKDIQQFIANHIEYTLARSRFTWDDFAAYQATAYSMRDRLIEFANDSQQAIRDHGSKMVYYMSIEYLLGRSLHNAVTNLGLENQYTTALKELGFVLEDLYEKEQDAALGNGGLGRLAACFLDSLATMNYPAWGYGLRYQYGMFKQSLHDGNQVETPDYWLGIGNPWEIRRDDKQYPVRYFGQVRTLVENGRTLYYQDGGEVVVAVPYDMPIPGYGTMNEFDFDSFNVGDYYGAIKEKQQSENICAVLYPNDSTESGRQLRLKQQYFFASATLQDILYRFKRDRNLPLQIFPDKVAIQLNDTHPTIGIAELMRLLLDCEKLPWDDAWSITTRTFAFTNHTVLPEALEKWEVPLIEWMLPRIMQIIFEINRRWLEEVALKFPGDGARQSRVSLIEEGQTKKVRMAFMAIVGSHSVNGVAAIHTEILKTSVFRDFYEIWPEKFNNKTNGVTPRRWLDQANEGLSTLLTETIGNDEWITNLDLLSKLRSHANDEVFQRKWYEVKLANKARLAKYILEATDGTVDVNPNALFDIHVKRIHEYKRQLLNIFGVIHRYLWLRSLSEEDYKTVIPRVVIFAGKAAPGYYRAKKIIKFINNVATTINNDHKVNELLKVVFLPNYNVSLAEKIIPANDISQHISTAGTEASGTSNMKFTMNGGLLLGTLDGANIEIRDEIGEENMFIFGALAHEVDDLRKRPETTIDSRLVAVLKAIQHDELFGQGRKFDELVNPIWKGNDFYCVAHDFPAYLDAQNRVDECFRNPRQWAKKSIMTVAGMGKFSSDRTIKEYAEDIWNIKPVALHDPITNYHN